HHFLGWRGPRAPRHARFTRFRSVPRAEPVALRSHPGADDRDRTGDLVLTKDVLCQLSYIGLPFAHRSQLRQGRPDNRLTLRAPKARPPERSGAGPSGPRERRRKGVWRDEVPQPKLERETGIETA